MAGIVGAYVLGSLILGPLLGWSPLARTIWQPVMFLVNGAALLACATAWAACWRRLQLDRTSGGALPAAEAWQSAWRHVRRRWLARETLARVGVVYLLLGATSTTFASWKPLVADRGFGWDAALIQWEAALHGGRQPWEWLHPLLGTPWITAVVDLVYAHGWRSSQSLLMFGLAVAAPSAWRTRALVTLALAWIVGGSIGAVALSSAGPIYAAPVHGLDTFAPLVAYLERVHALVPLDTIETRDYLWAIHAGTARGVFPGISAMPSMHLASTAVLAVVVHTAPGARPWMRWLGWGFLGLILVGSVHLAWHYALDGYVAIGLVLALWWLSGRLVRRAA